MTHKQKLHVSLLEFFLLSTIWRCCCYKSSHKSTRNIADAAFRLARSKYDTCIWLCLLNFKWNFTTVQRREENEEKNLVNNTSRITLIQIGYIIPQIHRPAPRRSVFSLDFFFLVLLLNAISAFKAFVCCFWRANLTKCYSKCDTILFTLWRVFACCNSTLNGIK